MTPKERIPGSGQKCGCSVGATGRGAPGICACPACGRQIPHEPGVPCREVRCPQCGAAMIRRD